MDSHKLPNLVEAYLPPHHRSTGEHQPLPLGGRRSHGVPFFQTCANLPAPAETLWHGRFDNPWPTWEERSFKDVLRWNRARRQEGIPVDGWAAGSTSRRALLFPASPGCGCTIL